MCRPTWPSHLRWLQPSIQWEERREIYHPYLAAPTGCYLHNQRDGPPNNLFFFFDTFTNNLNMKNRKKGTLTDCWVVKKYATPENRDFIFFLTSDWGGVVVIGHLGVKKCEMGEDLHFTTTDNYYYYYYLEQLGLLTIYTYTEKCVWPVALLLM